MICVFLPGKQDTQLQEMQDNQHAYSVSTHADCSSTLHPLCLPCTFQISDWKLMEDTTCMKLVSLLWLEDWVWLDSNESWTCEYGVVVFGRWTVSAEPVSLWVRYFGVIKIRIRDPRSHNPSDMCSPTWETHIPSDMTVFFYLGNT